MAGKPSDAYSRLFPDVFTTPCATCTQQAKNQRPDTLYCGWTELGRTSASNFAVKQNCDFNLIKAFCLQPQIKLFKLGWVANQNLAPLQKHVSELRVENLPILTDTAAGTQLLRAGMKHGIGHGLQKQSTQGSGAVFALIIILFVRGL